MKYKYKTSLRELRSSLKYRAREYLLENTLHGVPYFVDSTRPKWERLMWLVLTLGSLLAILVIIVIILQKFQTEPTITGLDIDSATVKIDFPQIFICFGWTNLNHSYIYESEMDLYEQLYNWNVGETLVLEPQYHTYANKKNFRNAFEMMKPDCNFLISDCTYKGINVSCSKLFTAVIAPVGACCKTKDLEQLAIIDTSWKLEFLTPNAVYPLRIYFTEQNDSSPKPGERPTVRAHFPIDVEFVVDITYTTPDIGYLLLRQRQCYFKQEGLGFNDCEINCIIDELLAHCRCLPWFLSSADKVECPLSGYSCLNRVKVDMSQCNCWLSCNHTSYTSKEVKRSPQNISQIGLRNWPAALYKREMRFGYLDLLVSFGGIVSLFLGYSLLLSIELGYYFTLKTYCGAVIEKSQKQYNIVTVHVVEKLPQKLDTKPIYYQYID